MESGVLTKILKRFSIYLEDLPQNLRLFCFSVLISLAIIDIALMVYNNIDNENFSYIRWAKAKILKIEFIIFALYEYERILEAVKSFFFFAVEKAIRVNFFSGEYFDKPSFIFDQGMDLANYIYDNGIHFWKVSSWIYLIVYVFIIIGYLVITLQLIICWVEYYFLTGFSIVFLPFGVLDMTLEYYKNVFKVIMGQR